MKKRTLWNKLFHSEELKQEYNKYLWAQKILETYYNILELIDGTTSLMPLMLLHKKMWKLGYQNENLKPCSYGMFRTQSIPKMTSSEVYLGGIYGLTTNNIDFWENFSEEEYGDNGFGVNPHTKLYDIILNQYKRLLRSNCKAIYTDAKKYAEAYEKINK